MEASASAALADSEEQTTAGRYALRWDTGNARSKWTVFKGRHRLYAQH